MTPPAATEDPPVTDLAERRTQREREETADFDPASTGDGPSDGQSIEDIEASGSTEEEDGQYALVVGQEGGKEVTLGNLVKRNTPITLEFKLTGKSVPGLEGMLGFANPDVMLLVPARAGRVITDPTYGADDDGQEVVKSVKIRQEIRPVQVLNAKTPQARAALLGYGDPIAQLVAAGRADGTKDADIRAALINEVDVALAQRV